MVSVTGSGWTLCDHWLAVTDRVSVVIGRNSMDRWEVNSVSSRDSNNSFKGANDLLCLGRRVGSKMWYYHFLSQFWQKSVANPPPPKAHTLDAQTDTRANSVWFCLTVRCCMILLSWHSASGPLFGFHVTRVVRNKYVSLTHTHNLSRRPKVLDLWVYMCGLLHGI